MANYGQVLFEFVPLNTNELLKILSIDINSSNEIYALVNDLLEYDGYEIRNEDGYFDFLKIRDNDWTHRAKGDASIFFANIKMYLMEDSKEFAKKLSNVLKRLSKWEKRSDVEAIERASRNFPR